MLKAAFILVLALAPPSPAEQPATGDEAVMSQDGAVDGERPHQGGGDQSSLIPFHSLPIWINALIFPVGAAIIWLAGTKIERYTDALSGKTGLGHTFAGMVLLATATSLPEVATTVTASINDNTNLALHNIFGAVIVNTTILAVVDVLAHKGPLTRFTPHFVLMVEGLGVVALLAIALTAMVVGGKITVSVSATGPLFAVTLGPVIMFLLYLAIMYQVYQNKDEPRWVPSPSSGPPYNDAEGPAQQGDPRQPEQHRQHRQRPQAPAEPQGSARRHEDERQQQGQQRRYQDMSVSRLWLYFGVGALFVLVAGWVLAKVSDALATQTGLGSSFVGAALLAVATCLPELSTTTSAVRNGNYSMAVSNIFGSSMFNIALVFLMGLVYTGGPVLRDTPPSAQFAASLGIVMTCVYLWGMLERKDRTFLRMGVDSWIIVVLYIIGMAGIYSLK